MRCFIAGGGGFIGGHVARALLHAGHEVVCADIKPQAEWWQWHVHAENHVVDVSSAASLLLGCDRVYNFASNMGGVGFLETNRALCMENVLINTQLLRHARAARVSRYFFASSACVYPTTLQAMADVTALQEDDAYPALPEGGYGWEKLFSERLCEQYYADFGVETRVFRFHNVYGPHGAFSGGREKAIAAICRKVIEGKHTGEIEIWGDGEQTRTFMYIDDCVTGLEKLMASSYRAPLNLGRSELVTINQLVDLVERIAGTKLVRRYRKDAPQGVRGRSSDNTRINRVLEWEPSVDLATGVAATYAWIAKQHDR